MESHEDDAMPSGTFQDLFNSKKSVFQQLTKNYVQKKREQEQKQETEPDQNALSDPDMGDGIPKEFEGIFGNEESDNSLAVFDDSHKVDKNKFRSFGTTIGINYNTRSKTDQQKKEKIRENRKNGEDKDCKIKNTWTESEDKLFIQLSQALGSDPVAMAKYLPHKTVQHVRQHLKYFKQQKFAQLTTLQPIDQQLLEKLKSDANPIKKRDANGMDDISLLFEQEELEEQKKQMESAIGEL